MNFGKENDFNEVIIFTQRVNNPFDFILLVMLLFLDVSTNHVIVKIRKGFGHDFVNFLIYELVLIISQHIFELSIAVGHGS